MAVFLVNTCKFNSCGLTFPTLTELIRHIEETHLDFDPRAIEEHESQQPSCLPISYILRVFADNSRKESVNGSHNQSRKGVRPHSPALSLCSTPPTGSEMEDEDNRSVSGESSIDSWVNNNVDNDSANAILKIMSPQSSANPKVDETDRPYVCTTGNCKKRYRNSNGLKYHIRKIHKNSHTIAQKKEPVVSQSPPKEYKCICGKIYKTSHGLKNHKNIHHNNNQTTPQKHSQSQAQTQTSGPLPVSIPIATQTTQSSTPVQTQTTQTTSVQTNTTIIGKSPVINGQTLSPATKESILATFVRCRPIQTLPTNGTATGVQTRIDGLPLMLTLQTDDSKNSESDSITNDKKILINGSAVKKCPAIAAPTLQQHLLSPIVGKPTISVTKIL